MRSLSFESLYIRFRYFLGYFNVHVSRCCWVAMAHCLLLMSIFIFFLGQPPSYFFSLIAIERSPWWVQYLDLFDDGNESVSHICDEMTFYRCLNRFICIKRSKYGFLHHDRPLLDDNKGREKRIAITNTTTTSSSSSSIAAIYISTTTRMREWEKTTKEVKRNAF